MPYQEFSEDDLVRLLFTEEDRLPRAAVDEFLRRGERMIPFLAEIVSDQLNWTRGVPEWWAVVHATFILGAMGTESAIVPFLRALRWADAFDCDWVTEAEKFFATVQNKLHFAMTGKTAAEIIASRVDRHKSYMGLTAWRKAPKGPLDADA